MNKKLIKPFVSLWGLMLAVITLSSCAIANKVIVRDYDEKMELVKINFPEIYDLYVDGKVIIDKVYTYDDKKTGTPRVNVSYHYR